MAEIYNVARLGITGNVDSITIESFPIPDLAQDEILVQMEYSTINPSDTMAIFKDFSHVVPPISLGNEGSGTVIKSGGSELANSLLHKRVAIIGAGCWGDYVVANTSFAFPLTDSTSFEQAANLIVNPMTVACFIEKIQKSGHKAVVQNAAASALGKMLIKWCKFINIPLINIVRRQEQVDILKAIGAEHVVNSSEEGWKQKAIELAKTLGVSAAFDAIAGESTDDLAEIIEDGGIVYSYGILSGQSCRFQGLQLIAQRKRLEGLMLIYWLLEKSYQDRIELGNLIQGLLENVTGTEHSKVVNISQIKDTLSRLHETGATNNKILVRTRLE